MPSRPFQSYPEKRDGASFLDAVPVPVAVIDAAGYVADHNTALATEFPRVADLVRTRQIAFCDLFRREDAGCLGRFLGTSREGSTVTLRLDIDSIDTRAVLLRKGPAPGGDAGLWVVIQSFREVDDFTRARSESGHESDEHADSIHRVSPVVSRIADSLPFAVWAIDHEGDVALWNQAAERLVGLSHENIRAQGEECLNSIGIRTLPKPGRAHLPVDPERESAIRFVTPDGEHRWVRWFAIGDAWSIRGWRSWGLGLDVTDQYSAFRALQESERRYRDVLRNVDLAGIMVDEQGRVLYLNDHLLNLTDWSELALLGLPWRRAFAEAGQASIQEAPLAKVLSLDPFDGRIEGSLRTAAGEVRDLVWTQSLFRDVDGRVVGACALGMDVTEQRRAAARLTAHRDHLEELVQQRSTALAESERRLRDSERLAALGRLSAGVSHDMGNMLLPVRCHLDRISNSRLTESQRASFSAVRQGIEFLDHLGEGLELLAGDLTPNADDTRRFFHRFLVQDWFGEVLPLLRGMIPESIVAVDRIEPGLPEIRMPRHLLTRAVMNLVKNAVEAIEIEARRTTGEYRGRIELRASRSPDESVCISVADNGHGIEDSVLRQAADPFFTTKPRSLSTGLGLSVSRGVARMAGGTLELSRQEQGGTRASIIVPAYRDTTIHERPPNRSVMLQVADPRARAICRAVCEALSFEILEPGTGSLADIVIRTPLDSLSEMPTAGQTVVVLSPTEGVGTLRKKLLAAIQQGEVFP